MKQLIAVMVSVINCHVMFYLTLGACCEALPLCDLFKAHACDSTCFAECPIPGEISFNFIRKDSASSRSLSQKRTCAACVKRLRQAVLIQNGSKSTTGQTQGLVIDLYLNGGWRLRQNARRVFLQIKLCPSWRAVVSTPLNTTSVLVAEWLFSSKRLV
jgi:hypothetical protein